MAEDSVFCFNDLLDSLDRVIEELHLEDYAAADYAIEHLMVKFTQFTKDYRLPHLPGEHDERLYTGISDALAEYLQLSDRLLGQSPHAETRRNLNHLLRNAQSVLEFPSPEAAQRARAIIDDALTCYEEDLKQIEMGTYLDPTAVGVFWKLWPAIDMFIRCLSPEDYASLAPRLYGVVSEGLRSAGAVRCLHKLFDEVFPFKRDAS